MPIKVVYSDEFGDSGMDVWDLYRGRSKILHIEIQHPHPENKDPCYGITWYTRIPTQQGLDAIRDSYRRLKERFVGARELPAVGRYPFFKDDPESPTLLLGPVTFALADGITHQEKHTDTAHYIAIGSPTLAMDLSDFLNPDSLKNKDGVKRNPLDWIRVDTEYLSYYFQGEILMGRRDFGVLGVHDATDEILRIFSETSSTGLSPGELTKSRET